MERKNVRRLDALAGGSHPQSDNLAGRFAVGRICVVADRGLISTDNVDAVADAGFDHLLATRLHRDHIAKEALEAIDDDTAWVETPQHRCPGRGHRAHRRHPHRGRVHRRRLGRLGRAASQAGRRPRQRAGRRLPILTEGDRVVVDGYTITVESDDSATHTVTIIKTSN